MGRETYRELDTAAQMGALLHLAAMLLFNLLRRKQNRRQAEPNEAPAESSAI